MKKNIYVRFSLLIYLVCASMIISSCGSAKMEPTDVELLSSIENALVNVTKRSKPAIVSIVAFRQAEDGKIRRQEGSGFIFRKDGYILTNEHVIRDAKTIRIQLFDGSEFDAELDGRIDRNTDIAVLKIDAKQESPCTAVGEFR